MKTSKVIVTVRGVYPFPIDMLRYDALIPAGEVESLKIIGAMCDTVPAKVYAIELTRMAERDWKPTYGRWQSFGWIVTEVKTP